MEDNVSNILYFIIFSLTFYSSYAMKQKEDMFSASFLKMNEIQEAATEHKPLQNINLETKLVDIGNIEIDRNDPNIENELVDEDNVKIDMNAPVHIVDELTSMGMPCTVRLYNEFGRHFRDLTSTFFSKVEKIDRNTLNLMLVIADHTYNKDKRNGSNSTFKSSFGAKFWKVANEMSRYLNNAGLLTTSLVSTVYLAFGGKCTFDSDEANCQYEVSDDSESGLTFYDISKYLGPAAVFLYNFSDNTCEKVMNYSSTKKTMYKSLDLGADYFYFIKDFVADNGNIDLLPLQYKYGIVDFTNIPQSFFNEYGPFFTKATRLLLKDSVEDISHESRASIYAQKAQEDDILEKTYKKIDTYQWISGILNPLSGLCSLLVSTSLTLHTCVNDKVTKWFSQLCSVVSLPLSYIINFASKKIDKALNKEVKNYMLYAYYQHANKAAREQ